jgi:hypothetical protein
MGNPGGYGCDAEDLASNLTTNQFTSLAIRYKVTWTDVLDAKDAMDFVRTSSYATQADIDYYTLVYNTFLNAWKAGTLGDPIPLCGDSQTIDPAKDKKGFTIGYTKPVLLLTDLFSASAAELFAAILQDNKLATLYGTRTNGAGGAVDDVNVGAYMEAGASVTRAIVVRNTTQTVSGFPTTSYIENVGVAPDIADDFMTADNLINKGAGYVQGFTKAIVDLIQKAAAAK